MEVWAEDQLTRRERLRAQREREHGAPARIRLRFAGVLVIIIALLSWVTVSWLSSTVPASAPVPEPPTVQEEAVPGAAEEDDPSASEGAAAPGAPSSGPVQPPAEPPGTTVVHVGGAVAEPGVVELPSGARVHEAIDAAGGMTSKADPGGLNLAAPVQDGTLIWVPTPEEVQAGPGPPAQGPPFAGPPVAGPDSAGPGELINLNTADAAALEELPGIGPALSERIISHREANGPFGSLEELAGVRGIGPVILADVEDLVTW